MFRFLQLISLPFPLILILSLYIFLNPAFSRAEATETSSISTEAPSRIKGFVINAGTYTEFYDQVQIDTKGEMREFDRALTLGFGLDMPLSENFVFLPEFNWVLPRKARGRIVKNIFQLRADVGFDPVRWFRLRAGTSLFWLNQQGGGGEKVINNGNSTSTFFYPTENRSSLNNTLDLGAELILKPVSFRFQTYTFSPLESKRRQISYALFISYYWER